MSELLPLDAVKLLRPWRKWKIWAAYQDHNFPTHALGTILPGYRFDDIKDLEVREFLQKFGPPGWRNVLVNS